MSWKLSLPAWDEGAGVVWCGDMTAGLYLYDIYPLLIAFTITYLHMHRRLADKFVFIMAIH